jgi:hypothetical protein
VKLSITHRCGAPEFGSNLNVGQAREAAPDDQAARRRVAGPNEIAASSSKPDEIEVKSAGFSPSAAGAADESIEQADFVVCESDRRRSVVLGSRQHGQPENPPTENADLEPCRPPFGLSRLCPRDFGGPLPLLGHPESGLAALFDESKVKTVGPIKREFATDHFPPIRQAGSSPQCPHSKAAVLAGAGRTGREAVAPFLSRDKVASRPVQRAPSSGIFRWRVALTRPSPRGGRGRAGGSAGRRRAPARPRR